MTLNGIKVQSGPLEPLPFIKTLARKKIDGVEFRVKDIEFVEPIMRGEDIHIHLHDVVYPWTEGARKLSNGKYIGNRNAYVNMTSKWNLHIARDIGSVYRVYHPAHIIDGKVHWR